MIFGNLRTRLLLTNVAVMAAILLAIGGGILLVMDRILIAEETSTVEGDLQRAVIERNELSQAEFQERHTPLFTSGTFVVEWDKSGTVIFNPSQAPTAPFRTAALDALNGHVYTVQVNLRPDQPALITSQVLKDQGQVTGVLQAGRSLVPVTQVEHDALLVMLGAGLASLLVIVLAGWFLTERALVPIRRAMDRQVRFTADASHELRSPLTIVDAGLQVLGRHPDQTIQHNAQLLDSMSEETKRMTRLVDRLLTLARVDSGQAMLDLEPTDVSQLVVSTGADLQVLAAGRGGHLEVQSQAGVEAQVDRDRLRQVLVILVDNALLHGAPGGTVLVRFDRAGHELRLEVADRGPGIAVGERDRVFEPFHQLDGSRTGSGAGLGLSIARWIVSAHGGTIKLSDNEPGLVVRISIPLRDPIEHPKASPKGVEASANGTDRWPARSWWREAPKR